MNVDIITTHPRSLDYPQWRSQLELFAPYYRKVIVGFTGHDQWDYSAFVRGALESTLPFKTDFLDISDPRGDEDWRNVAVNESLEKSDAEWIWFLEQDFFWKNKYFIESIFEARGDFPIIGFWEANRLHPACLLVKRGLINSTRRDFGAAELDHFGKFSQDIVSQIGLDGIGELGKLGLEPKRDWYHMQGITHNYNLCRSGDIGKVFKREEFLTYNRGTLLVKTIKDERFIDLTYEVEKMLGGYEPVEWLQEFWKEL